MKPKYIFWATALVFALTALKCAVNGEKYVALLVSACSLASAIWACHPSSNGCANRSDLKKILGIE